MASMKIRGFDLQFSEEMGDFIVRALETAICRTLRKSRCVILEGVGPMEDGNQRDVLLTVVTPITFIYDKTALSDDDRKEADSIGMLLSKEARDDGWRIPFGAMIGVMESYPAQAANV